MAVKRTDRINSLLKEVLSEVITKEVKDPKIAGKFISVTSVDITKDLRNATVFVSIIADDDDKIAILQALKTAAGFISVSASKKVVLRFFPALKFKLDSSVDAHIHIEELLQKVKNEHTSNADHE